MSFRFVLPNELRGAVDLAAADWRANNKIDRFWQKDPGLWTREAEVVTSDHFDEDGLASLFFVVEPEAALAHVGSLVGIARAGDFDVLDTVEAGRAVWALHALADPERSPFSPGAGERGAPPADWSSLVYAELLGRIVELIEHLDRFRQWWAEEDTSYRAGLAALSHGDLHIEEHPDLDLAVVRASAQLVPDRFARIGHAGVLPVHPAVLHSATPATRVLVARGRSYCYYDRYETWVRYVSRRLPLRRDLEPLAVQLSGEERRGPRWEADSPGTLVPVLRPQGDAESSIPLDRLVELVRGHLESAPGAWAPFREGGAYVAPTRPVSAPAGSTGETTGRGRARWRGLRRGGPSA